MAVKKVDLRWSGDPPEIYCPACGKPVYKMNRNPRKCGHIVFTYIDEISEFDYVSPKYEGEIERALEKADRKDAHPVEMVLKTLKSKSILSYSITTSGMACGPASSTVYIAIDFNPINSSAA